MIKLSKKWSYAIRAMLFIWNSKELLKISDISCTLKISESLLRRIMSELEKDNLIISLKWRNWWVKLAKSVNTISMYDILVSIWEELSITDCTRGEHCDNIDSCSTTNFYSNLQTWIHSLLKMYTLDKMK